ncbi:MAG: hypothetical protein AAF962_23105 [Actinomycetota bacterium]
MSLHWRALAVDGDDRSAIYAETFPKRLDDAFAGATDPIAALEAFSATAALEILATFAGAWGSLHQDANGHRWQYRSLITAQGHIHVIALRAVALDPDERWVVVDDVELAQ